MRCSRCVTAQPSNHPTTECVPQCLETISNLPEPPSGVDEEMEGSDDWNSTTDPSIVGVVSQLISTF